MSLSDQSSVTEHAAYLSHSADQTSRIVHVFMRNFVVRPAVEPRDRGARVMKAWREAASTGR